MSRKERTSQPAPEALGWSAFAAARDGMEARLLDEDGTLRPARELTATTLGSLGSLPAELGCEDELRRLAAWVGGAARQREAVARGHSLAGFLARVTD